MESRKVYQVTRGRAGWCRTADRGPGWVVGSYSTEVAPGKVARHSGVERPPGKAACTSASKLVIAVGPE
jgi:hypothetical protein